MKTVHLANYFMPGCGCQEPLAVPQRDDRELRRRNPESRQLRDPVAADGTVKKGGLDPCPG